MVQDFNTSGQVVGSNESQAVERGLNPLGLGKMAPDNLNEDIAAELASRIHLTGALYIDDLGRIIAEDASTGEDYLLTPTYLPSPAPEPSTLSVLGMAFAGLGVRAWRLRKAIINR